MDLFRYQILRVSYGGCWCIDCRRRVNKPADRRRARRRLKKQDQRWGFA